MPGYLLGKAKNQCRDPGSNRGPLDLQSNALPTELSRHASSSLQGLYSNSALTCIRVASDIFLKKIIPQVLPRFELGSLDSESRVLTITP